MTAPVTSNLIAASAGTGKTYKLASRFISLMALGYPAEKLIALTFTRNAAGEFKSRILRDIAKGAVSDAAAAELTARINETLTGGAKQEAPLCPQQEAPLELGRDAYREMLRMLVRKLPRLNLSTLDSFFSRLVGSHCLELGYPNVVQLDDAELARVRRDAIIALLHFSPEDEDGLAELCQLVSEDSRKNILDALEESVARYYTLYQDAPEEEVWGAMEAFGFTDERVQGVIREHLHEDSLAADDFLRRFLDDQELVIMDMAEAVKESVGKLSGAINDCLSVVEKCRKHLGYVRSKSKDEWSVGKRLAAYLYGGLQADNESVSMLMREIRFTRDVAVWLPLVRKTRGIMRLVRQYDERYREEVRGSGRLVFDDMPRLVADQLLNVASMANIAYRLDGQLDHWMLDEFQDTAPEQWAALRPLLEEIRSVVDAQGCAQRSLFVVGDEKQSIYGWRGATPRLFSFLRDNEQWHRMLRVTEQNESYRSSPAIMGADERNAAGVRLGFVNALFSGLAQGSLRAYTHHRVAERNRSMPGYVGVEGFVENAEGLSVKECMCRRMAEILQRELDFTRGGISAAILVRSNREVSYICNWFREHAKHLPVESLADEKVGSASLLGEFFLHFFKWMLHPGDSFSRSMLAAPHTLVDEEGCAWGSLPLVVREGEADDHAWKRWRELLEKEGYAAALMELTAPLAGERGTLPPARRDRSYREWLNAARGFDAAGGSLEEWLLFIGSLTTKANPPKSCIHVMTYHKSKGMEYDVALLPFSSPKAVYQDSPLMKRVREDGDRMSMVGVTLNPRIADKDAEASPYRLLAQKNVDALMAEAYNTLYVAVTRAKYANYILLNCSQASGKKPHAHSYSEIISQALGGLKAPAEPVSEFIPMAEWGDPFWVSHIERKQEMALVPQVELSAPHRRRRKMSPSKLAAAPQTELSRAAQSAAGAGSAADFGTAVHALFEQVEWLDQQHEPDWLQQPATAEERLAAAALHVPAVRDLYTRQSGQEAYNEQPIDAIRGDAWISGTLDRLVLTYQGNKVVSARIIDFKTDLRRGSSPAEQDDFLRRSHREQMRSYHELISLAFPGAAVSVTLISCPRDGSPARAVSCSPEDLLR